MKALIGRSVLTSVAIVGSLFAAVTQVTGTQVRADEEIAFAYSDPFGLTATGRITVVNSGLKDGSKHAISGHLEITANPQYLPAPDISSQFPPNHYVGRYELLPAGPDQTFYFDDQTNGDNLFFPDDDAADAANGLGVPGDSYLTGGGLLFGTVHKGAVEISINIYSIGDGVYGCQICNAAVNNSHDPNTDLADWAPEQGTLQWTNRPKK
jgi:hypothetical protein